MLGMYDCRDVIYILDINIVRSEILKQPLVVFEVYSLHLFIYTYKHRSFKNFQTVHNCFKFYSLHLFITSLKYKVLEWTFVNFQCSIIGKLYCYMLRQLCYIKHDCVILSEGSCPSRRIL